MYKNTLLGDEERKQKKYKINSSMSLIFGDIEF